MARHHHHDADADANATTDANMTSAANTTTTTTTTSTTTTTTSAPMDTTMAMQPTAITGSVTRYYVDPSGYVSAMDVQATDGSHWVSFAPGMAQQLTQTYPAGSTATVYVDSDGNLLGTGPNAPAASSMMWAHRASAMQVLKSVPYTTIGSEETTVRGNLRRYIADRSGDVLALVLDNGTIVRVPLEARTGENVDMTPEGVQPLFKGEAIEARGYVEAPVFGSVSPFRTRLIARSIVVNGESVGARGFGRVGGGWKAPKSMDNWSPEQERASWSGYSTFSNGQTMDTMGTNDEASYSTGESGNGAQGMAH
jgi:hypothetical protein